MSNLRRLSVKHLTNNPFFPFPLEHLDLQVQRLLLVSDGDDYRLKYLPLHPSQNGLPDDQLTGFSCVYCHSFAFVTRELFASQQVDEAWTGYGMVHAVVYRVLGRHDDMLVYVADTTDRDAAYKLVKRLEIDTGAHGRCWEISMRHLDRYSRAFLEGLADRGAPTGLLFEVFRVPACKAIGVKLLAVPWLDSDPEPMGQTRTLWDEHGAAGVPAPLLTLLHLAAYAKARFLIFDPEARTLKSMPLFND